MEKLRRGHETTRRVPTGRIAAAAFVIAGLSTSAFAFSTAGATTKHAVKSVVVSTVINKKFGTILVSGKTLYTLTPSKLACTALCLKIWPEFTLPNGVANATAGRGVNAKKLGIVKRPKGVRQVTYFGKALYWFVNDRAAGQVNGNFTDKRGRWSTFVTARPAVSVTPATSISGSRSTTTSPGTGGIAF